MSGAVVTRPLSAFLPPMRESVRRRGHEEMERKETFNALIAIPLCMLEVAWDMTDSVCDVLSIYRVPELKRVCRMLRQSHKDYLYHYERNPKIESNRFEEIKAWCANYLESTDGDCALTEGLTRELKARHPDICTQSRIMALSAYKAWLYMRATVLHTEAEEWKFAKKIGMPEVGHMLPHSVYAVIPLLESVFSETPLNKAFLDECIRKIRDFMKTLVDGSDEPKERTEYRYRCIAYVCNGGCRSQAVEGQEYGCYASSVCPRMAAYDKRQDKKQ